MSINTTAYAMLLANGQGWRITATDGARPWLQKLASIMELEACDQNGYPKLIFIRRDRNKEGRQEPISCLGPNIGRNLPSSGWKARRLPALQTWSHSEVPDVVCEIGHDKGYELDILRMLTALYPIFEGVQDLGGLPLHAALVERNGTGILLAASGDTGKSTCCRRLQRPWQPICDDETLVVRDDQKQYLAHPLPTWSDYLTRRSERTWNIQRHLPLSAIFFLEQAETDEVVPIGDGQTAMLISQSANEVSRPGWVYLDGDQVRSRRKELFDNACELARSIPAFVLRASLKGRFWEEMEGVLF
jgi:SynChlorMet cassette protein ScmC